MATSRYSALCEDGPDTSEMVSIQTGARDGEHTKTPAIGPDQDENAKPAGLPDLWSSLLDVCLIIAASLFLGKECSRRLSLLFSKFASFCYDGHLYQG
jgi:hypothetical protein